MQLISTVGEIGLPLIVVTSSALVLVSAVRSRHQPGLMSRFVAAVIVFVWLRLAGEAAFGHQRPMSERQWKGAAALLLAAAGASYLWKHYRRRNRGAPEPAAVPHSQPTPAIAAAQPALPRLAVLVTMPALGQDVIEGTVTRWLKHVGDRVEAGEPLVEISTDKVDTEIPADASGNLRDIRVPAGSIASVGTTIAVIEPSADTTDDSQRSTQPV